MKTPLRNHKIICATAKEAVAVAKRLEEMGEMPEPADSFNHGFNVYYFEQEGSEWFLVKEQDFFVSELPPLSASEFLSNYLSPVEYWKQRAILLEAILNRPDLALPLKIKYQEFLDKHTRPE
mgnify:CR=1 FL=1